MWIANYLAIVAFALLMQDVYGHDMEIPPDVRAAIERYKVAAAKRMGARVTTDEVSDVLDSDEGLDLAMAQKLESSVSGRQKRKSMNFKSKAFSKYKWPVNKPIPYKLDSNINAEGAQTIRRSLDHIKAETCLRFSLTENPTENYILFQKASSSLSMIGRQTDKLEQIVRLSNVHIRNTGEIVHQVCHALGMWHEHQRPDRDQYIEVVTENIEERELGDFRSVPSTVIDTAGLPYDYTSLMHFHGKTRSNNQELTLKAKDPLYQMAMGQRVGLSFLDAQLLNKVYCSETCGSTSPAKQCQHGGYTDPNKCNSCKCPDGFSGTYCGELAPSVGASCGGELDAIPKEQELTSPGYGSAYDYNQECTWKIKAPATGKVQVRFDGDFSIFSPGGVCQHWVEIRKKTELGTYGPRFCGNDKPSTVLVSDGEELLVVFRAKYKNNQLASSSTGLHGFKLLYKAVNVAVSPCKSITCQNGGSCNEQTYKCICPDGYSGDLCETGGSIRINPCHPNPCVNGGSCQVAGSGYSCKCPAPFRGTNCDEASCGGCGGAPGSTDAPCYGDNFGAKEKCYTTVRESYYYYYSRWSWRKCRGYRSRRVVKDCMCCANAVLIPPAGRTGEHYCAVTGWSDWGPCSDTCGGGEQFKRRYTVATQETYWGSSFKRLVVAEEQSRECNTQECTGWQRWYYGRRRRWGWPCCYGYQSHRGRCRK